MTHALRTQPAPRPAHRATVLRKLSATLYANASFSTLTGVVAVVAADSLADSFGVTRPWVFVVLGVGLLGFAAVVALATTWARRSADPHRRLSSVALGVSLADAAWVFATLVVLPLAGMTAVGNIAAVVAALAVADFAVTQVRLRAGL